MQYIHRIEPKIILYTPPVMIYTTLTKVAYIIGYRKDSESYAAIAC